eukprot:bmy_15208T0
MIALPCWRYLIELKMSRKTCWRFYSLSWFPCLDS